MKNTVTHSIEQTIDLAHSFVREVVECGTLVCLQGDLGSGKTTFAQGILGAFGAQRPYTSPTFTIIKEYDIDKKNIKKIYHIDAYRVGSRDMIALGWEEIISKKDSLVVVEWPENISDIVPENAHMILCEWVSDTQRKYTFKK